MRKLFPLAIVMALLCGCDTATECFVEAERFDNLGGWTHTSQYMDQMGSPYLQAHGLGCPVTDATTTVTLPRKGEYYVFVRTFNWTSPWTDVKGPGQFMIRVDDQLLPDTLGCEGNEWMWQYAGSFNADKRRITLALHDLTGFEGRCDAIYLSPTRTPELSDTEALRNRLSPRKEVRGGSYDFVVVGGGLAGMCAAVAASRLGLKTALIQDRPVLGGNNSSEIRVHTGGVACKEPYPNLGMMIREFGHDNVMNGHNDAARYCDDKKKAFVEAEPNLTVFYNEHVNRVDMQDNIIVSVCSENTITGVVTTFRAPVFADCTGDGNLGFLAGADYMYGREAKSMTGEKSAVDSADNQVMGASVLWNTMDDSCVSSFPDFEYGLTFTDESVRPVSHGEWTWETGMLQNQITEAERIRDYGMLVAYANWSYLKNHYTNKERFATRRLSWMSTQAGKRESRRLIGDYVLNQTDILDQHIYDDASVTTSWSIDLHYPDATNSKFFPGHEFISTCVQEPIPFYPIPYRCFYSRNIHNLFMAGRDISVTHAALGTVRVMRTTGMMGEVVGMAASVCVRRQCLPRDVYTDYLSDLQSLMQQGAGKQGLPDNQNFELGRASRDY